METDSTKKKNYCKSRGEPLSMCTYYDSEQEVECEYLNITNKSDTINNKKICTHYFNEGHCKCQEAQDEGRK